MMKVRLVKPLSPYGEADDYDVHALKTALNQLGYYMPPSVIGIEEIREPALFKAINEFQRDNGIAESAHLLPHDTTVYALNEAMLRRNPAERYIWRSVRDERVRDEHAQREGQMFLWSNPPKGGHPGEDYNCRCWAEPIDLKKLPRPPRKPKKKPFCFDAFPWEEEAVENIIKHEDDIEWPYLDTKGKITIAIGSNIDGSSVFMSLPWKIDDKAATKEEIEAGYRALRNFAIKRTGKDGNISVGAEDQKSVTSLRLLDMERSRLFRESFVMFKNALPGKFPGFKCFPPTAKIALMDMIFNLGETRFNKEKWDDFFPAINRRDWKKAAAQSHRILGKDKNNRNQDTYIQFMQAAEMEAKSQQEDQGESP